jgi:hypothetical protein
MMSMIGRQRAGLIFCALALSSAASGNVIITSGSAQTVFHSFFDFTRTNLALDGAGFSSDLGPFDFIGLRAPEPFVFGPTLVNFNFTQQAALYSTPLSPISTLTYNGTAYGAGSTLDLQLNFMGPAVAQQASCDYYVFPSVLRSCSVGWSNVPFTMDGWFRILNNGNQIVAADTLTGLGLASGSAVVDSSGTNASVSYVFTTPELSSLALATTGLFCLELLRRAVRRQRFHVPMS